MDRDGDGGPQIFRRRMSSTGGLGLGRGRGRGRGGA